MDSLGHIEAKRREFDEIIANREICDAGCKLYQVCSMAIYAPHCMLTKMDIEDLDRYFKIFYLGEDGLRVEINHILFEYSRLLNLNDVDEIREYLEALLKVNRQLYGDKKAVQKEPEALKVNITRAQVKDSKTPVIINSDEDSTTDPESLYNSDKLHNIVART